MVDNGEGRHTFYAARCTACGLNVSLCGPVCPGRKPEPGDGPDYHADLAAWKVRAQRAYFGGEGQ